MTADGKIHLRSQQQLVYLEVVSDFLQRCNPIVQKKIGNVFGKIYYDNISK